MWPITTINYPPSYITITGPENLVSNQAKGRAKLEGPMDLAQLIFPVIMVPAQKKAPHWTQLLLHNQANTPKMRMHSTQNGSGSIGAVGHKGMRAPRVGPI